jgi:hypothetical protein
LKDDQEMVGEVVIDYDLLVKILDDAKKLREAA